MFPASRFTFLIFHCLIVCGAVVLCGSAFAESGASSPRYRKVIVRVVDERGEALAGVTVQLLGTERDALQANDIETAYHTPGVWRYVSDAHGRCVVRLGCFRGFDSQKIVGKEIPGWGRFYFIAETGHLRGVSRPIVHEPEGLRAKDYYEDEWNRNGVARTSLVPVTITLRMRRGLRVVGRVIDTAGKPMRGFDIGIQHDLHSEHHTGYGNEIFRRSTATDEGGHFTLDDIFPNTFYIGGSMDGASPPVWVRTKLRGKWRPEAVDMITPLRGERVIRMILVISNTLPYRYAGRILDEKGKPVLNAEIFIGVSRHRKSRTYEDNHRSFTANADADGRFEFHTATPFVWFVSVKAPGFEDYVKDYEAKDKMRAPGEWNITLRRAQE